MEDEEIERYIGLILGYAFMAIWAVFLVAAAITVFASAGRLLWWAIT